MPGIDDLTRVAVTPETIDRFDLPELPGKATDSRGAAFALRHGKLVQVEVEALDPRDLRNLFRGALEPLIDEALVDAAIERENDERGML